jgi:biotin-dependent carboxylase-like uncharacterized protein
VATGGPAFEVISPGLLSTVQDAGRPGFGHLGVPRSGAADPSALAIANLLAGNDPGAAAMECTLLGPTLLALRPLTIAIAGADLGVTIQPSGHRLPARASHALAAGDILGFELAGSPALGCRAYIAIGGAIDVPVVLGSRSTSLVGAFGGFEGRPLRTGDVLQLGPLDRVPEAGTAPPRAWPGELPGPRTERIRLVPGPAAPEGARDPRFRRLIDAAWSVAPDSDRRGLRLIARDGSTAALSADLRGDQPSHGVVPGAVQLTPSGQPLILMPDAGTTGGYPVVAVVATADLSILGQLVPGSEVSFEAVDVATARHAEVERRRDIELGAERLASTAGSGSDPWDDLWRDARG